MVNKLMTESMGGVVGAFVKEYTGTTIRCFGVCHKDRLMNEFTGYEHDGGIADNDGNKWWVYYECPICHYGHSFAKMEFFIKHTKIEHEAEVKNGRYS